MKDLNFSGQDATLNRRKLKTAYRCDAHERRVLLCLGVLSIVGLVTAVPFLMVFG